MIPSIACNISMPFFKELVRLVMEVAFAVSLMDDVPIVCSDAKYWLYMPDADWLVCIICLYLASMFANSALVVLSANCLNASFCCDALNCDCALACCALNLAWSAASCCSCSYA